MTTQHQKANRNSTRTGTGVQNSSDKARDREMGRTTDVPLGDLGEKKTWQPPSGEQGLSNRADDEGGVIESLQTGSRPRRAAADPVADQDPNAEDASLAADSEGVDKVRALKDETDAPAQKDQDVKGTGGRRSSEVIR